MSAACDNCYAEAQANRFGKWFGDSPRRMFGDKHWAEPLKWNRKAEAAGVRASVFCGSMCDVFEGRAEVCEPRQRLCELIEDTPSLDWLLLTKRPKYLSMNGWPLRNWQYYGPPDNVWLGVTAENQEMYDRRCSYLVDLGRIFVSLEPLLGPVDLTPYLNDIAGVIVGGESGPNARPMDPDWARSIRDQCAAAGVKFFFKQWGEWLPGDHIGGQLQAWNTFTHKAKVLGGPFAGEIFTVGRFDDETHMIRVGKPKAGRVLDGRTWDELPWRSNGQDEQD